MTDNTACENTDRELWLETPEDPGYSNRIFVTQSGGIGISVAGSVYVKPLREWHRLAGGPIRGLPRS